MTGCVQKGKVKSSRMVIILLLKEMKEREGADVWLRVINVKSEWRGL